MVSEKMERMKTLYIFLIGLFFSSVVSAQDTVEELFSIQDGKIVSSTVRPFGKVTATGGTVEIASEKIATLLGTNQYLITLSTYKEFQADDGPDAFTKVSIKNLANSQTVLEFEHLNPWVPSKNDSTIEWFKIIHLAPGNPGSMALLFQGHHYPSDPGLLTLVLLYEGQAAVIFNFPVYLTEIDMAQSAFSAYGASGFIQYMDIDKIDTNTLPTKYHIWQKSDRLYMQTEGFYTQEFLK